MYKLLKHPISNQSNIVLRIEDNVCIPFDPANSDYQAYLKWMEEGGVPLPADEGTQ